MSTQTDIAVIDDDLIDLELIERYVKKTNYSAALFDNPREALAFLESNSVRLLLVDTQMPMLSGLEVLAILNSSEQASVESLFLCSAAELPRSMQEQAEALGARVMTKDLMCSRETFVDFVAKYL